MTEKSAQGRKLRMLAGMVLCMLVILAGVYVYKERAGASVTIRDSYAEIGKEMKLEAFHLIGRPRWKAASGTRGMRRFREPGA